MTTGFWSFLSPSLFVFIPFYIYNVLLFHWGLLGINQGISHFNMDFIFFFFFYYKEWVGMSLGMGFLVYFFFSSVLSSAHLFFSKRKNRIWNYSSWDIFCRLVFNLVDATMRFKYSRGVIGTYIPLASRT